MSDQPLEPAPPERIVPNTEIDQQWADYLAPTRRNLFTGAGAAAVGLVFGAAHVEAAEDLSSDFKAIVPPRDQGISPWGTETAREPTPRPKSLWPGYPNGLPEKPR